MHFDAVDGCQLSCCFGDRRVITQGCAVLRVVSDGIFVAVRAAHSLQPAATLGHLLFLIRRHLREFAARAARSDLKVTVLH